MSKYERGYHPLSQVEAQEIPGLSLSLPLPTGVDKDKIGVNVRRLQTMERWGGIRRLEVQGIQRIDDKLFTCTVESANTVGFPANQHAIHLGLNIDEIARQLGKNGAPPEATKSWIAPLDEVLKETVAAAGTDNVLEGMNMSSFFVSAGVNAYSVGMGMNGDARYTVPSVLVNNLLANSAVRFFLRQRHRGLEPNTHRWSLFYGPQFDRAAILAGMKKTTVVKYLGDKE